MYWVKAEDGRATLAFLLRAWYCPTVGGWRELQGLEYLSEPLGKLSSKLPGSSECGSWLEQV